MIEQVTVHVPGTAMDALRASAFYRSPEIGTRSAEERAQSLAARRALQEAPETRRGRGRTFLVAATPEVLLHLADQALELSEALEDARDTRNRPAINALHGASRRMVYAADSAETSQV